MFRFYNIRNTSHKSSYYTHVCIEVMLVADEPSIEMNGFAIHLAIEISKKKIRSSDQIKKEVNWIY